MTLVGVNGYAQAGKDSIGKILIESFGFERRAFADPVREALYRLNPLVGPAMFYADLIDDYGYEAARKSQYGGSIRRLLQKLGTEVGRQMIGEDVWVDIAMRGLTGDVVFTDCRFPNEARAVKDAGGEVWRVDRPGVGPANGHVTETALDDWPFDVRFLNDGTLAQLEDKVAEAMGCEVYR